MSFGSRSGWAIAHDSSDILAHADGFHQQFERLDQIMHGFQDVAVRIINDHASFVYFDECRSITQATVDRRLRGGPLTVVQSLHGAYIMFLASP